MAPHSRSFGEEAKDAYSQEWASVRAELESAYQRFKLATDNGGIGIWDWDIQNNAMLWDDWMYRLYGTTRQAGGAGYELWQRHLHPDDRARTEQAVANCVNGAKPYSTEFRIVWDDGSIHHIRATGHVTRDVAGEPLRMIGCNHDITPLILAERARAEQQVQAKRWLELAEGLARVGHWTVSVPGQEIFWSDEIYRMHGRDKNIYTPEIVSAINAYHSEDRSMVEANLAIVIAEKSCFEFDARLIRPDGEIRHVLARGVAQTDYIGEVTSIFGIFIDVTEQKVLEQKLENASRHVQEINKELQIMAHTDELTGLSNRRELERTLKLEFGRSVREQQPISLIMIDLDFFKNYNDCYGHVAGDECLRAVASAIKGALHRSTDLATRYGGEEFAVVLSNTGFAGTSIVAESIVEAVRALRIEHREAPEAFVTVSCGIAVMENLRETCEQTMLFDLADRALYDAKRAGKNRVRSNFTSK
jgi:diguanylate cyclase (GGDEF)-like protein/PAS domain S-box-containing protein